jgi:hypothetical protein
MLVKRGFDGLVHRVMHASMNITACSACLGGQHGRHRVPTREELLEGVPLTCFWCLVWKEGDEQIH